MAEDEAPSGGGWGNRRWRRLSPLLFVLLGFGAGVLASQFAPGRHRHRGEAAERRARSLDGRERSARFRERLVERLDLDEAQTARLDAFLEGNRAEARAFWEDTHTRYRELRGRFREQIREMLTETQRETFDSWIRRTEPDHRRPSAGRRGARP